MKTTVIDATQLIQIEYKGQRVLTVKQLTALYGCGKDYIAHRFGDNKEFFTEGVHYFKLEGANLVEFRKNFYRSISSLENADENSNCENSQLEAALKLMLGKFLICWKTPTLTKSLMPPPNLRRRKMFLLLRRHRL